MKHEKSQNLEYHEDKSFFEVHASLGSKTTQGLRKFGLSIVFAAIAGQRCGKFAVEIPNLSERSLRRIEKAEIDFTARSAFLYQTKHKTSIECFL